VGEIRQGHALVRAVRTSLVGAGTLALALAVAGCATAPARLDLAAERPALEPSVSNGQGSAPRRRVLIRPIEDRSGASEGLGSVGGRPFTAADVGKWIDGELAAVSAPSFTVVQAAPADVIVRPRLLKAYLQGVYDVKTAVIVLECEIVAPERSAETRRYRGQHASLNWASTESEVTAALRDALSGITAKLACDIDTIVLGRATPACPDRSFQPPRSDL
jgi:hypothetical protein